MTEIPPSRFRVVERGRRLEVIDTQAGRTLPTRQTQAPRPMDRSMPRLKLPEKLRFDGGGAWTTAGFYDSKGPRTLTLDAGAMQKLRYAGAGLVALVILWALLGFVIPIMWVAPMLLINPKMRETVREQMTRFIDRLESAG